MITKKLTLDDFQEELSYYFSVKATNLIYNYLDECDTIIDHPIKYFKDDFSEYTISEYIADFLTDEDVKEMLKELCYESIEDITYEDLERYHYANYSNLCLNDGDTIVVVD